MDTKDPNSGFDALLDTMTNAVGILIIVLAIAHLTLHDTVQRVAKRDPAPPVPVLQEYQQLQTQLEHLDKIIDTRKTDWEAAQRNAQYSQAQLAQLQNQLKTAGKSLLQNDQSLRDVQKAVEDTQHNRNILQRLEEEVAGLNQQLKLTQLQQMVHL